MILNKVMQKKIWCIMLFFAFGLFSQISTSFELIKKTFKVRGEDNNKVEIVFNGYVFDDPIKIPFSGKSKNISLGRIMDFLGKFIDVNKKGDEKGILNVWEVGSRSLIKKNMTKEALEKNSKRFNMSKSIYLNQIIAFGDYYILYLDLVFENNRFVMKIPVSSSEEGLFLTNALNDNYFYKYISDYLDETNYK